MNESDIREKSETWHFDLYKRYPVVLDRAEGARVWDLDGREYLDALAGIAVNNVGHCHPNVVKAVQEQAARLIHVSNLYYTKEQSALAETLARVSGFDKIFFCNSGAEANEAAVKLARKYADKTGRTGPIVALENCFHGRTIGTIALGKEKYRKGFGPMPAGIERTPANDIQALEAIIDKQTAALILEPIQGEGGVVPLDQAYLERARALCDEHGALLIYDEVQCGVGRTGKMFAWQQFGVKPDVLTAAKGLGGGIPIGAVMATREAAGVLDYGEHGTTFGGNSLATAAALAVLQTIESENLLEETRKKGEWLMNTLRERTAGWSCVKGVRGVGLMVGVELTFKGAPVVEKMLEKGVLSNCASDVVMRLLPPLVISQSQLETLVEVLLESIRECEPTGERPS